MSSRWFLSLLIVALGLFFTISTAQAGYGARVCKQRAFKCVRVKKGDTWEKLFPKSSHRDLVMRLNRMNVRLRRGQIIAVPKSLSTTGLMDISPFPKYIKIEKGTKGNTIVVSKKKLAWGAYNSGGKLVKWGPASAGKGNCKDVGHCRTPTGSFHVIRKMGSDCESTIFPAKKGGAPMPYCMFFKDGIALHGSPVVPGYNASHGCVRLFNEDARWLNTRFVDVIIEPTKVLVSNNPPKGASETQYRFNSVNDVFSFH